MHTITVLWAGHLSAVIETSEMNVRHNINKNDSKYSQTKHRLIRWYKPQEDVVANGV